MENADSPKTDSGEQDIPQVEDVARHSRAQVIGLNESLIPKFTDHMMNPARSTKALLRQAARLHALYLLSLPCVAGVLLCYGIYEDFKIHDYHNAAVVLCLVVVFFTPAVLVAMAEISQRRLLAWVEANIGNLAQGQAEFRGVPVTAATEVVVFSLAFSVLFASFKIPSQMLVVGRDRIWAWRLVYSVLSLIFGWWGIPWGPVFTVQSLGINFRTSERGPLLEMLARNGWQGGGAVYDVVIPR